MPEQNLLLLFDVLSFLDGLLGLFLLSKPLLFGLSLLKQSPLLLGLDLKLVGLIPIVACDGFLNALLIVADKLRQFLHKRIQTSLDVLALLLDGLRLRALLALPDGSRFHAGEAAGETADAQALGAELGRRLLAAAGPEFLRSVR